MLTRAFKAELADLSVQEIRYSGLSHAKTRGSFGLRPTFFPDSLLDGDHEQAAGGLLRAVFFEGFLMLGRRLLAVPETDDPVADVQRLIPVFRRFCLDYPALARVMFSRPFQDFEPGPEELAASPSVREIFVGRIKRCTDAGLLTGDSVDIAHVLLALAQGLAVQEGGRWLGKSKASVNRRWEAGVTGILRGFAR